MHELSTRSTIRWTLRLPTYFSERQKSGNSNPLGRLATSLGLGKGHANNIEPQEGESAVSVEVNSSRTPAAARFLVEVGASASNERPSHQIAIGWWSRPTAMAGMGRTRTCTSLPEAPIHYSPGLSESDREETKSDGMFSRFPPDRPADGHLTSQPGGGRGASHRFRDRTDGQGPAR